MDEKLGRPESNTPLEGKCWHSVIFVIFGFFLILSELPHEWSLPAWYEGFLNLVFGLVIVVPVVGFSLGWIEGFPRWANPYVGLMILFAFYLENASTPGLRIGSYPIFGRQLWGWRSWILPGFGLLVGLIFTRSLQPALSFFRNIWEDWTRFTYLMFGCLPLYIAASFDEMDRLYSLYFMVVLAILMILVSQFYLRSRTERIRVISLLLGSALIVVLTLGSVEIYWQGTYGADIFRLTGLITLTLAILYSPYLISRVKTLVKGTVVT